MRENYKNLLIILLAVLFYRIYILYTLPYQLYFDEAYYWFWSRNFDFGYYSKPPMVAWIIRLSTSLCSNSEFCIKLPFAFLYFFSSIFIYLAAKEIYDKKVAFYSSILFFTLPSVFLSSIIAATDGVFLFFWSLSLYFFIKALKKETLFWWIILGVSVGFGLLSKYTMIFFPIGVLFYLFFRRRDLLFDKRVYLFLLVSFLIFLPNLWWNFQNHFITFLHTKDNANIRGNLFHLNTLFEFLGSQFGVFGVVFFPVLLYLLFGFKKFYKDDRYFLLFWFIAPLFYLILVLSYISRAHANWSAPVFIAACVLVTWFLFEKKRKKLLYFGIIFNIFLGILVYHFDFVSNVLKIELTAKNDPYKKTRGWREISRKIEKIREKYGLDLIFDDRMDMSEMGYYLNPRPKAFFWNPDKKIENYFEMIGDLNLHKGESFLFVTKKNRNDLNRYFKKVELLKIVRYRIHKDYKREYKIYLVENFKGY